MAAGTVAYTDTRGNKDYLGMIASQIGKRLKQASNMASEERAYAAGKAEAGGTSLEEAGIGKGYFFKRALGSRFGGDRIARTRGRLGAQGPGKDPTKNYKQRFRGGFDYNVTNEIQSATVPLSSALVGGLRGVESGLDNISQALATMGSGMSDLARGQNDLAKATYYNGMILRVMVTEIKRQQARLAGRREERSLESGRPRLSGGGGGIGGDGRRMINVTPQSRKFSTGNIADVASGLTNPISKLGGSAAKGAQTSIRRGLSSAVGTASRPLLQAGSAVSSGVSKAAKYAPNIGKLAQATAKYLGTPVSAAKNFFGKSVKSSSSVTKRATQTAAFLDAQADMVAEGFGGLGRGVDNNYQMLRNYDVSNELLAKVYAGAGTDADLYRILEAGGYQGNYAQVLDPDFLPPGSSGALANTLSPDQAKALAPARIASLDNAGYKAAEIATDQLVRSGTKEGLKRGSGLARMMVKQFGAAGTRSILKKIPVVAGVAGILFGIQRAMEGDYLGAGLEVTSGLLGATGVGGGAGLAIDGYLLARDFGVVPMAKGGLLTGKAPVNALMGEAGPEIVTPLNDETFIKFGEGFIDAQKRNRTDSAKIQAEGLKQYYEGMGGWNKFGTSFKGIFETLRNIIGSIRLPSIPELLGRNRGPGGATAGNIDASKIDADSPQARALIATIREVEGTAGEKGYDTWFGGRNEMKMTDMTLQQVYDEQTRRMNAGETTYNGLSSAAVGVGQFMDPLNQARAMYAARGQAFDPTKIKFDQRLQNELLLDLAARKRGIDVNKTLTKADFDILQMEWAGLGTYYGQTKRTTTDSLGIYQGNLSEANRGLSPLLQNTGTADQNATALNSASSNLSMLSGLNLSTPTIINNTNYYTNPGGGGSEDGNSLGSPFDMLSAFNAQYSLSTK
jgi:hypothetical protein